MEHQSHTVLSLTLQILVDGYVPVPVLPHLAVTFAVDAFSTITCTATDDHDNVGRDTFTISVVDTTAPVLPTLDDIVVEATGSWWSIVPYGPFPDATDPLDGECSSSVVHPHLQLPSQ